MRPFVTSFFFLLGLIVLLVGVMLNLQSKAGVGIPLVIGGLAVTFVSLYFKLRKTKEEATEEYPEPEPEEFEAEGEESEMEEPEKQ